MWTFGLVAIINYLLLRYRFGSFTPAVWILASFWVPLVHVAKPLHPSW